jgi:hypothetical protein
MISLIARIAKERIISLIVPEHELLVPNTQDSPRLALLDRESEYVGGEFTPWLQSIRIKSPNSNILRRPVTIFVLDAAKSEADGRVILRSLALGGSFPELATCCFDWCMESPENAAVTRPPKLFAYAQLNSISLLTQIQAALSKDTVCPQPLRLEATSRLNHKIGTRGRVCDAPTSH